MEVKNSKDLKAKIKEKIKTLSNTKIYVISFFLTSAMTYKYATNRFLYREHHGHFNSPQNMLNKRVFQHHVQEIVLRMGFGIVGISGILLIVRGILRGPDFDVEVKTEKEQKLNIDNVVINSGNKNKLKEFEFENVLDREFQSDKNFNMDDVLKNKKVVDEYFKNKK